MTISSPIALSEHLKPLCSRDDHVMKYESRRSTANTGNYASYHCASGGCSVRYNSIDGYFTLMGIPGQTYSVSEPRVNTVECPAHGGWLYRQKNLASENGVRWSCGIEGCNYSYEARTKGDWLRA